MWHLTHMNAYGWFMSHNWVMSHIWMSHVAKSRDTHRNESRHMFEWVMSHTCECVVWHWYAPKKRIHMCEIWLTQMCDMTHSYVWHDSFLHMPWLIKTCDMTHSCVWHDSLLWVTWLIAMCDMTYSYVWHDSLAFICAFQRIFIPCAKAHAVLHIDEWVLSHV